jgi:integrase
MGMLYRRKKRNPVTRELAEFGPWWMKYYRDGWPFYESTGTEDKTEARRKLKEREGQVASGLHYGPQTERTRFEDLVSGICQDYDLNERKSVRRLNDFITHLSVHFKHLRASAITTDRIKEYVSQRRKEGAANGTINRELACLKRMFRLALQSTPPRVARMPHIPMLEEHNIRSGFFSHEEYLAIRGVLPDYAQVAVSIAYYTGLRIGEILGLKWAQIDLAEGKLSLTPLQTKTETPRVVYLPPDLHHVLLEARRRHEACSTSPWVCQRYGKRLLEIKRCWKQACRRIGLEGRLVHDFRRTAVRNMSRAGIPEKVAMAISGHKTRSVFDRYNIINEADLKGAAKALATYYEQETVTLSVTLAELSKQESSVSSLEPLETWIGFVEPATRIERATCGLRISYGGSLKSLMTWVIPSPFPSFHQLALHPASSSVAANQPRLSAFLTPY